MNKLEDLCLEKVAANLWLHNDICKKFGQIIPEYIGQKIFENLLTIKPKFSMKDVNFFNRKITKLREINLTKKNFCDINSIDFLNGQELNLLIIRNDKEFLFNNSTKFFLRVENLIIKVYKPDMKILRNLFNHIEITNSVYFDNNNNNNTINTLSNINFTFKSFGENLKIFDLSKFYMNLADLKTLLKILSNMKYLSNLYLNFKSSKYHSIKKDDLEDYIKILPKSIESLKLILNGDDDSFIILCLFVKNLKNLKEIYVENLSNDENFDDKILKSLEPNCCKSLEILELTFCSSNKSKKVIKLDKLIQNCSQLKKFTIKVQKKGNKFLDPNFLLSLNPQKLMIFKIPDIYYRNLVPSEENFLLSLKSLKSIDIGDYLRENLNETRICELVKLVQRGLTTLEITNCTVSKNFVQSLELTNLNKLNTLRIDNVKFLDDSIIEFFKKLKNALQNKNNLQRLDIVFIRLNSKLARAIKGLLLACCHLEIINFNEMQSLDKENCELIFNGLKSSNSSLKTLKLTHIKLEDERASTLAKVINNFSALENIELNFVFVSENSCIELLNNLYNSKRTFKNFTVRNGYIITKQFERLEKFIKKNFCNLTFKKK